MQPHVATVEFDALHPLQWGWSVGVVELGVTPQYDSWWVHHMLVLLTDPIVPISSQQMRLGTGLRGRGR